MFIRRLARRFAKPVFISPPFMLEQLEDRIVMDAAVPATPDNQPDNHAAAAAAPDAAANPAAGQDPAAAANPASAQGNSGDSASSSQSSDPAHSSASPSEVFSTPLSDVLISIAPDAGQDASHSAAETPHNDVRVLVVSSTLQDADKLAAAAAPDIITVMYDGSADTPSTILSVIENALAGKKADSIAFAGHELGDGKFSLTPDSSVDLVTVATDAQQQAFWEGVGGLLAEDGRVDLMVCNLGATAAGDALVSQLEILTGHDVAASDDPTGNPQAGGDWTLEDGNVDLSAVYFDAAALSQYQGILADSTPVLSLNTNAGSLDPTFSEDGKVTTDLFYLGYEESQVSSTAIQSDGKIVVVGGVEDHDGVWDYVVLRYNSDGSLDTTFSGDGIWTSDVIGEIAHSVAIQADGKIVVAGGYGGSFGVLRLTADGNPDSTFSGDGWVSTDMGGWDHSYGVAIQADGKIVVAGYTQYTSSSSSCDFAVARYNTDGNLDNTFSGDGKLTTDFAGDEDKAYSVAIDANGKIVVAGYAHAGGWDTEIAVARYTTTGDLDTTFSGDGKVTTEIDGANDEARSVAIQADGRIVVAGYGSDDEDDPLAAMVRYTSNGTLDNTFNGNGIWWADSSTWYGPVHVVAIQSDGKIVMTGDCEYNCLRVDRFNTDGSHDWPFGGGDGYVYTDFGGSGQTAYAVAIQADGKIVAAGQVGDTFAVARYDASQMAYSAGDGAKVIDANITLTDADSANMASATVEITGNYQSGQDTLGIAAGYTLPSGVTAVWTAGTLTISGVAAKAQYDDILEHVTYTNSSGSPNDAPRTLSWTVNDGTSNSVTKSSTITVTGPSNTAPTVEAAIPDVTVDEDATDTVFSLYPHFQDAEDTDAQLTYTVANNTNSGLFTAVSIDGSGNLGLDYAPDAYGAADITIRATDTGGSYVEDTFRVTVNAVNDNPAVEAAIPNVEVDEDAADTVFSLYPYFQDVENTDAQLTYTVTNNTNAALFSSVNISNPSQFRLDYAANANGAADITVRATDAGGLYVEQTFHVTVNAVNDAPTVQAAIPDVAVGVDAADTVFSLYPHFQDVEDADGALTYTVANNTNAALFTSVNIADPTQFRLDYAPDVTGVADITIRATDSAGSYVEDTFRVTVNSAPTVEAPIPDVSVNEDAADTVFSLYPYFQDAESTDSQLTYTVEGNTNEALFTAVSFSDPTQFRLDYAPDAYGVADITIRATDPGGLWVEDTFHVTVNSTPVLSLNSGAGGLDPAFSGDGKLTTSGTDTGYAVAVQADGKIVVAGGGSEGDFVVVRYNTDGSLDTSFSGDGVAYTDMGRSDTAYGVAIDADGKIVVVGTNGDGGDFAIARYNTNGSLDTSFSGDGKVFTDMGGAEDIAYSVAIQADGKIVVAGTNGSDFALARYTTTGALDTTFSGDGKLTTDFYGHTDKAYSVAIDADGEIVVAGSAVYTSASDTAVARYNADGTLDTMFGPNGKQTVNVVAGNDEGYSVAVQADGMIVIAGYAGGNFAVSRLTSDGALDMHFGTDGRLTTDIDGGDDRAYSVAIQADGKIVVGGYATIGGGKDFAVVRYTGDGTLDTTFDGDGKLATNLGGEDTAHAVAIQADGRIVVAGESSGIFALARYDASQMAYTLGGGAQVIDANITLTDADSANMTSATANITGNYRSGEDSLGIASGYTLPSGVSASWDGSTHTLTISGSASKADYDAILEHVTYTNSSSAPNYDPRALSWTVDDGVSNCLTQSSTITINNNAPTVETPIPDVTVNEDAADTVFSLYPHFQDTEDSDDRLTYTVTNNTNEGLFASVDISDPTNFRLDYAAHAYGEADITIRAADAGGKYVEDTFHVTVNAVNKAPVLSLNTKAGSLDPTFDLDGKLATDLGGSDTGYAVAVQSDGKIVVAGTNGSDFAVVRYNADGSLDTSFDDDGKVFTDMGGSDVAYGVAIQSDGKIVVVGANGSDFAIVRYNSDGRLDNTFDGDGKLTTDMGGSDVAYGVAINANNKIVVAGTNGSDFAVARYNSNGSLDTSFSGGGKVTTDFAGDEDKAYSVAIDADGRIVVAGYAHAGWWDWDTQFAVTRYNTDGTLDSTFSGDGKVTTDMDINRDEARSVAIQADGRIVVAGYGNDDDGKPGLALVRYTSTGTLDNTFSGDGIDYSEGGDNKFYSVALQADGKILAVAGDESYTDFWVYRFNTNGSSDSSFGDGGSVRTNVGWNDYAHGVAIQADGKIVVAGTNTWDFAVARYDLSQMAYNYGDGAKVIDSNITLTDADSANMSSATVEITGNYHSDQDSLGIASGYTLPSGVTASWNGSTHTLSINGSATKAQYEAVLEHVTYSNSSDTPNHDPRTLSWTVSDGGNNSVTKASTITVSGGYNSAPTVESPISDVTVDEDAADTVFSLYPHFQDAEDADAQLTYTVANNTNAALFSSVNISNATQFRLDYAANANGAADITIRATDTGGLYVEDTFHVTVNAVNDNPTVQAAIPDVAVNEDAADTVFSLYPHFQDVEDADSDLTYTVTNNTNEALFSSVNIADPTQFRLDYAPGAHGTADITIRATDSGGSYVEDTFRVTVNGVPTVEAPISDVTVDEDAADTVFSLYPHFQDAEDTDAQLSYTVTNNSNEALFTSVNISDPTQFSLDYAANASGVADITIRATDTAGSFVEQTFHVTVNAVNDNPAVEAAIPDVTVDEDAADTVFSLHPYFQDVEDADSDLTYTVTGNTNPGLFTEVNISNPTQFRLDYAPDANGAADITIRATDTGGLCVEDTFRVTVNAVNDAPVLSDLGGTLAYTENHTAMIIDAAVTLTDVDSANMASATIRITGNYQDDQDALGIYGGDLRSGVTSSWNDGTGTLTLTGPASTADYEYMLERVRYYNSSDNPSTAVRTLTWTVNDGTDNSAPQTSTVTVTAVNDAPTDISLSSDAIAENAGVNAVVAALSATDPDDTSGFIYALVSGDGDSGNSYFNISGSSLRANAGFDYETGPHSYSIRVEVTDGGGLTHDEQFTINVTNVNETPTDITLSSDSIVENAGVNAVVGTLSVTDPDAGDAFTYALVSGAGDSGNSYFNISGNELRANDSFDYETGPHSYGIRVEVTDSGGLTHQEQYTINVLDGNEPPVITLINGAGDLDSSFDHDGIALAHLGDMRATSTAIQSDGKIVVAGYATPGSTSSDFAVARFNADGSLDATFGDGGIVTTDIHGLPDEAYSVAIDADGKIVVVGRADMTPYLANYDVAIVRYNEDGSLDTGFGANGVVTTAVGSANDAGTSVAIYAGGKIVVAGFAQSSSSYDFAVLRYNHDGSLDASFDTDGKATTDFAGQDDGAYSVAIDADGRIVVAGYTETAAGNDFAVARYNPNGTLDGSFDTDGKVITSIGSDDDVASSVAIQSDGKVLVAGGADMGSSDFALVRYNDDGSLDTGFDGDGIATTDFAGGDDVLNSLAIQSDHKIVVAGYTDLGSNYDFALARFNSDGTLDTGFGSEGKVTTSIMDPYSAATSVAIDADGKIVAAGPAHDGSNYYVALARYYDRTGPSSLAYTENDGASIIDGSVTITDDDSADMASATIQITGNYQGGEDVLGIEAGYTLPSGVSWSFDAGVLTIIGTAAKAQYQEILEHVTYTNSSDNPNTGDRTVSWTVNDGTSDSAARTSTITVTAVNDAPTDITLSSDAIAENAGVNAVVGALSATDLDDTAFSYALVSGDGDSGNSFFNISGSTLRANDSFDYDAGPTSYSILVRVTDSGGLSHEEQFTIKVTNVNETPTDILLSNSSIAENAGVNAVVGTLNATDPDSGDSFTYALVSGAGDSGNIFFNISGSTLRANDSFDYEAGPTSYGIRVQVTDSGGLTHEEQFTINVTDAIEPPVLSLNHGAGALDLTFDGDGKAYTDFAGGSDKGQAVAVQSDGKIVVAGSVTTGDPNTDFGLARFNSDGTLDATFGTGGIVTTDLGEVWDDGYGVAIQADGKIVMVGRSDDDFAVARYNADGSLDDSFGDHGIVITDLGTSIDVAYAVTIQSDGKIVVVGECNGEFATVRYDGNGTLDSTFGSGGIVITDIYGNTDRAWAVDVQSDGKIVVAGEAYSGYNYDAAVVRYTSDGGLDASFGSGGIATSGLSGNDRAYSVVLQSDGKIVVAGDAYTGATSKYDFAVMRFNTNGVLDTSFDSDGIATTDLGSANDHGYDVAIQPDGKIVTAGAKGAGPNNDFAVVRYDSNGSLDTTFDGDGWLAVNMGGDDLANGVAIQADGKIVAAGYATGGSGTTDFAIARFDASHLAYTENDSATAIDNAITLTDPDSANITGATIQITGNYRDAEDVLAFTNTANITGSWNAATGVLTLSGTDTVANYQAALRSVTYQNTSDDPSTLPRTVTWTVSDGAADSVAQAGTITVAAVNDAPVLDLHNTPGTLDLTFDGDGKVITEFFGNTSQAGCIVTQADGKIVAVGGTYNASDTNMDFVVVRYNLDGSLDTSFDHDGWLTTDFFGDDDTAYSVVIQSDGKIVVAGETWTGSSYDFVIARYNTDGSLDATFGGGDGWVTTDFEGRSDHAQSLGIQSDGKIVAAGFTYIGLTGSDYDFAVARYNADGSLDASFDGDGKVTTDFFGRDDRGNGVAIQSDGKIVVAGEADKGSSNYDFAMARYNTDGSLDASFGAGGKVRTGLGGDDRANGIAIQSDSKIVLAGAKSSDFAIVRYTSDGSLDTSFDGDGIVVTDITGEQDTAYSVAIQRDGKIVAAGQAYRDFGVVRYDDDGSLDTSFGSGGKVTTDILAIDQGNSVSIQADGNILVLGDNGWSQFSVVRYNGGALPYVENDAPTVIDNDITLTDPDSASMASATIQITGNYNNGEDILGIDSGDLLDGVIAQWDPDTGALTLTGAASKADYESMLEHVTYYNTSDDPNTGARTVTWTVNDGDLSSAPQTSAITVTAVDDAPVLSGLDGTLAYTENEGAQVIDDSITLADPDSANMAWATIQISGNYQSGEDILGIDAGDLLGGVTANWDGATGTLTLTGSVSQADYASMLEHVTYTNTSQNPNTEGRTVAWTVNDGSLDSAPQTSEITVTAVDDPPTPVTPPPLVWPWDPWPDFSETDSQLLESTVGPVPDIGNLLSFMSSQQWLPFQTMPEYHSFAEKLSEALFAEGMEAREQAWNSLALFLEGGTLQEHPTKLLGLQAFLERLQHWQSGEDFNHVQLTFNADQIQLAEWFQSLVVADYTSGEHEGASFAGSTGSAPDSADVKVLMFNVHEMRVADLFSLDSHWPADAGYEQDPQTMQPLVQVFDLKRLSFADVAALNL